MRRSRAQLEQDFVAAGLDAQTRTLMNKGHVRTTFIGEAYPPSVEPISSLTTILLHDLLLETHHRGRVLIVKTFGDPIRKSGIHNAIEDVQGSVDRLSVYNLPSRTPLDRVLPKSAVIAVKEPYFKATVDDGVMVRVDHPSDAVLLEPHDSSVPPQWQTSLKATMTGSQLKEVGNTAFKQGDCEALAKTDNNTDLRLTLLRNRAQVHFNLGQYEFASEDAIAAVIAGDNISHQAKTLNVKSYFHASRAQYQLGNFSLANEYLEQALGLIPTKKAVTVELERTKRRLREQETGDFNFTAMAQSATASHRRLDHATFTNKTKVAPAGSRGRGLFATETIKRGSIVMVEKAFCVVFGDELGKDCSTLININTDRTEFGAHAECLYETTDKMRHNPHQASKVLDLFDRGSFEGKTVSRVDGTVVLNVFQVHAITELNSFKCPSIRFDFWCKGEDGKGSTGIWVHASYINHSCLPNARGAFIGDMMIVRATDDIQVGEKIFTSYVPATRAFPERKESLSTSWEFRCGCPLCCLEGQLPASVFTDRARLVQEAKDFIAANPSYLGQPVGTAKLAKAQDILRRLQATYDKDIYDTLPRLDCVSIDTYLVHADLFAFDLRAVQPPSLAIASTSRLLQDLGCRLKVNGSEASIDRRNGAVGMVLLELAKDLYPALNGNMVGFDEHFW
ncbi:hypothetical protein F5883DRAFT_644096 [Diaporthe sp. PMI_573]|nr:hypothetical protein F5883DRAFT_644096 [Diaporthaceae sp. PMI_573]